MEKLPQSQTIDDALGWHVAIIESVIQHRSTVLAAFRSGAIAPSGVFFGMTEAEILSFFQDEQLEVDGMCIVNIIAMAEAEIRADFNKRLKRGGTDALSVAYAASKKKLKGQKAMHPDFDRGGILDALKDSTAVPNHLITAFRHSLKIRHWYAHGRRRLLKTTAIEDPAAIHATCRALLDALPR